MARFDIGARRGERCSVPAMCIDSRTPAAPWRLRLVRGWAMALDTVKQARVIANRARMRVGRSVQVAAVYRTVYGGQRAMAVALVLKQQGTSNPIMADQTT